MRYTGRSFLKEPTATYSLQNRPPDLAELPTRSIHIKQKQTYRKINAKLSNTSLQPPNGACVYTCKNTIHFTHGTTSLQDLHSRNHAATVFKDEHAPYITKGHRKT